MILGAAVIAAGVASSMASSVYSVNVVGYINVTLYPGFNLVGNQLDVDGVDTVGTVLNAGTPTSADGIELLKFSADNYNAAYYDGSAQVLPQPGWWDANTGNASTNTIPPGTGFFIFNSKSSNVVITMAGTVLQGTNSLSVPAGFTLMSTQDPVAITLDTTATNNFPALDGMEYLTFTNTGHGGNYATPDYYDATEQVLNSPGWWDANTTLQVFPTPAVGQGYFIFNNHSGTNWTRSFQVQ